jgi:hypothetical protein
LNELFAPSLFYPFPNIFNLLVGSLMLGRAEIYVSRD